MKKFLVSMAVAALAIPALAQNSAPMRVAVIDVNKVLSSSAAGKAAAAKLKQVQEEKMARAQKMDEEINSTRRSCRSSIRSGRRWAWRSSSTSSSRG